MDNTQAIAWVIVGGVGLYAIYALQGDKPPSPKSLRISAYENLSTGAMASPNDPIGIQPGETVRVYFEYTFDGDLQGTYHVSYWQLGLGGSHDEISPVNKPFTLLNNSGLVQDYVDLPSDGLDPDKTYGLYMKIMSIPGDDIFTPYYSDVIRAIDVNVSLQSATAEPFQAPAGTQVEIRCPLTIDGLAGSEMEVTVKCIVYEGSILPGAGTKLWEAESSAMLTDGAWYFPFYRTSVPGTIDRRDVGFGVYIGGVKLAEREDDDVFYVI